jgi:Bacterial Ig-like domain
MSARFWIALVVVSSVGTACTTQESFTNLNPDGPPAIAEVRLKETYTNVTSPTTFLARRVFGFGTFPDATSDLDHDVTSASASGQSLRIIMDELLLGNRLEEVQCRGQVDDDAFSSVPDGATPDDIAACSVNSDALKASCHGDHAVCICQLDAGCGDVAKGDPVGVLDVNNDGAADNTSFKRGAVGIRCGTIDVPIDLDMSYWNPSGDQQVPAEGGYDALGPAIVLVPQGGNVPTNATCGLTFSVDVLDKQGFAVCTPPAGRPASCSGAIDDCQAGLDCTAGDVSAFTFKSEGLRITVLGVSDGATNVSATTPIFANANAPLAAASIAGVTITPAPPADFTITQPMPAQIKFTMTTPLAAATTYTLTFPVTLTDTFGQPLPAPYTLSFTTAP